LAKFSQFEEYLLKYGKNSKLKNNDDQFLDIRAIRGVTALISGSCGGV
jgi:hypothetical protein